MGKLSLSKSNILENVAPVRYDAFISRTGNTTVALLLSDD